MMDNGQPTLRLNWAQVVWAISMLLLLGGGVVGGAAWTTKVSMQMDDFREKLGNLGGEISRINVEAGYPKNQIDNWREQAAMEHRAMERRLDRLELRAGIK